MLIVNDNGLLPQSIKLSAEEKGSERKEEKEGKEEKVCHYRDSPTEAS